MEFKGFFLPKRATATTFWAAERCWPFSIEADSDSEEDSKEPDSLLEEEDWEEELEEDPLEEPD